MKKHLQFKIDGQPMIDYFLIKKNIKNIWMRLNSKNEIVVSAPKKISQQKIDYFIKKNILKFFTLSIERQIIKPAINEKEKYFYLFGEKNFFEIDEINKKIIYNDKKISIATKSVVEAINQFRKKEFMIYLIQQQLKLEKIMNIPNHLIYIRNKSTSWATNYVNKKKIIYSINLSSFSKEVINYVIIHELSHNVFANHSKEFWNMVKKFEPNYKEKRLKLSNSNYS